MNNLSSEPGAPSVIEAMRRQIGRTTLPEPARPRLRQRLTVRPRLALGGGLTAVAGSAAAVVPAVGGGAGAPAAYAITDNPDGSVTITLNDLSAIPALNAKLAADGVAARAVPETAGCVAPVQVVGQGGALEAPQTLQATPPPVLAGVRHLHGVLQARYAALEAVTVTPPTVSGRTLVLGVTPTGRDLTVDLIQGPAPSCVGLAQQS